MDITYSSPWNIETTYRMTLLLKQLNHHHRFNNNYRPSSKITSKAAGGQQYDPFQAWVYMGIYWSLGAGCNYRKLTLLFHQLMNIRHNHDWTYHHHGLALLGTLECQRHFNRRFHRHGREPDRLACWVFAMMNGIFETLWFLGVYDFGRVYVSQHVLTLSDEWAIALGWSLYYIYSAVIHVWFWLPLALPDHTKSSAPPFHRHGLPLLTVISMAWFTIYEHYHDVGYICFLHAIVDGWGAWSIGLPGPYAKKKGDVKST